MTESEWHTSGDPVAMLSFLRRQKATSERKLRLFGVACCRLAWSRLSDDRCRRAVEAREGYEDGLVTAADLKSAQAEAWRALVDAVDNRSPNLDAIRAAAEMAGQPVPSFGMRLRVAEDPDRWVREPDRMWAEATELWAERVAELTPDAVTLCHLIRCVSSDPFRPAPWDPSWRTETVVLLARGMYESRDFGAMPILADALEEAGCGNEQVLEHCRAEKPHVRGCHVVDWILGRE
jgi:hypothetical protein